MPLVDSCCFLRKKELILALRLRCAQEDERVWNLLWSRGFPVRSFSLFALPVCERILVSDERMRWYLHGLYIWHQERLSRFYGGLLVHVKPLVVVIVNLGVNFDLRLPLSDYHVLALVG